MVSLEDPVMKMSEVVIIILGIMKFVSGDNCLDVESVVHSDKYMEHQVFRKTRSQSLYNCASECLMSSACLSFGFEKKTRTCLLNSNGSDTVDVIDRTGFVFSDIQHWPKVGTFFNYRSSSSIVSCCPHNANHVFTVDCHC